MDQSESVNLLNDLLALETQSWLTRLREAGHYVSWPAAGKLPVLRSIIAEHADHEEWLIEAIDRLGGAPRPRALGIRTAGGHYVDADYLLPRIVDDERRLAETYRRALRLAPSDGPAAALLARIAERHENHAERLQRLIDSAPAPARASAPGVT